MSKIFFITNFVPFVFGQDEAMGAIELGIETIGKLFEDESSGKAIPQQRSATIRAFLYVLGQTINIL